MHPGRPGAMMPLACQDMYGLHLTIDQQPAISPTGGVGPKGAVLGVVIDVSKVVRQRFAMYGHASLPIG